MPERKIMSECCLTLLVAPAIHERLLDAFLMTAQVTLFTSTPAAAHGLAHHRMSTNEQVLGMAAMTQVQVLLALADRDAVLASLAEQFAGSGLRYWLTPVLDAGEFA
jgi:hypothetical protein